MILFVEHLVPYELKVEIILFCFLDKNSNRITRHTRDECHAEKENPPRHKGRHDKTSCKNVSV